MRNYWSCSKFADWLRGTSKPFSATKEEWHTWKNTAQLKAIRYWIAEDFLDGLQNFLYSPYTFLCHIQRYIKHRWITKTHLLKSTLQPGVWYDLDERLLYAVFDELVIFVETELAWSSFSSADNGQKKYNIPWWRIKTGLWRSSEAGLDYLHWASELKLNEERVDKSSPDFGKPTQQAFCAQEILVLYQWWKNERPNRPDPYEQKSVDAYKLEQKYDNEDTEMLIRLIKIRQGLWT